MTLDPFDSRVISDLGVSVVQTNGVIILGVKSYYCNITLLLLLYLSFSSFLTHTDHLR